MLRSIWNQSRIVIRGRRIRDFVQDQPLISAFMLFAFLLLAFRQSGVIPMTFGLNWSLLVLTGLGLLAALWTLGGRGIDHLSIIALIPMLFYSSVSLLSYAAAMRGGWPSLSPVAEAERLLLFDVLSLLFVAGVLVMVTSTDAIRLIVKAIVVGATVSALLGLAFYATGVDLAKTIHLPFMRDSGFQLVDRLMRQGFVRPQGAAGHPLEFAAVMAVAWPLSLVIASEAKARGARWKYWTACSAVIFLALAVSLSRSALISAVLSYIIVARRWSLPRIRTHLSAATLVVLVAVIAKPAYLQAVLDIFVKVGDDRSLYSRTSGLATAFDIIKVHPLLGQGYGSYTVFPQVLLDNAYLGRTVETGILGGISFFGVMLSGLFLVGRARLDLHRADPRPDAPGAELLTGLFAAQLSLALTCAVLDVGGFIQIWYFLWLIHGLCGAAWLVSQRRHAPAGVRASLPPLREVRSQ